MFKKMVYLINSRLIYFGLKLKKIIILRMLARISKIDKCISSLKMYHHNFLCN